MRVLGSEATADPTAVEAQVRQQMEDRAQVHSFTHTTVFHRPKPIWAGMDSQDAAVAHVHTEDMSVPDALSCGVIVISAEPAYRVHRSKCALGKLQRLTSSCPIRAGQLARAQPSRLLTQKQ